MSIFSKVWILGAAIMAPWLSPAQETPLDARSSIKVNLPPDSPVALLSADVGQSRATARGGAMVLDLHMALSLRNSSGRRIRGITLLVSAQELTPGGKGSVTKPSLNVASGEAFPVEIELRLLRPLQTAGGPLVQVNLDGVLFSDFHFYGPNHLDSRRALTAYETEAQRDRRYFKTVLETRGSPALQREMLDSLARQAARPRLDVVVSRGGRSTPAAAGGPERLAQFAFLKFPDAPVELVQGEALIAGSEARSPRIQVVNRSQQPVRYFEVGWIVRDRRGVDYLAASVPASDPDLRLAPGQSARALQNTSFKFSRPAGEPISIDAIMGFVNQVEYANGAIWVPNRESLENAQLLRVLAPSPEEQRLSDIYHKKGLAALIDELKKF